MWVRKAKRAPDESWISLFSTFTSAHKPPYVTHANKNCSYLLRSASWWAGTLVTGPSGGPRGVRWHKFGVGDGCGEREPDVRRGAATAGRRGPAGRGGLAAQRRLDGARRRAVDPDRPERGRQDHLAPGGSHLDVPHRGHGRHPRRADGRGGHLRPAAPDRPHQRGHRRAGPAR